MGLGSLDTFGDRAHFDSLMVDLFVPFMEEATDTSFLGVTKVNLSRSVEQTPLLVVPAPLGLLLSGFIVVT